MTDIHNSPVVPVSVFGGQYGPYAENMLGIHPTRTIVIDSRDRNRVLYKSANHFRIRLQHEFKRVFSLALRMAIVPATTNTQEHYCVLRVKDTSDNDCALIEGAVSTDREMRNPVFDSSFAIIPFRRDLDSRISPAPVAVYQAPIFQKQFTPPKAKLNELEFSLYVRGNDSNPTLHALPCEVYTSDTRAENNVLFVFEIISAV